MDINHTTTHINLPHTTHIHNMNILYTHAMYSMHITHDTHQNKLYTHTYRYITSNIQHTCKYHTLHINSRTTISYILYIIYTYTSYTVHTTYRAYILLTTYHVNTCHMHHTYLSSYIYTMCSHSTWHITETSLLHVPHLHIPHSSYPDNTYRWFIHHHIIPTYTNHR